MARFLSTLCAGCLLLWMTGANAQCDFRLSSATLYAGQSNSNDLLELVRFRFGRNEPYRIIGVGVNHTLFDAPDFGTIEWANQLVKHFDSVSSWLTEIDTLIELRWKRFPWNSYLLTSLGLGEGLSLATNYQVWQPPIVSIVHSCFMCFLVPVSGWQEYLNNVHNSFTRRLPTFSPLLVHSLQ